jgi:hypothetical protein
MLPVSLDCPFLIAPSASLTFVYSKKFLVFSGVRVTRSLVFFVIFLNRCLFFCPLSFGQCVVSPSSIYGF